MAASEDLQVVAKSMRYVCQKTLMLADLELTYASADFIGFLSKLIKIIFVVLQPAIEL